MFNSEVCNHYYLNKTIKRILSNSIWVKVDKDTGENEMQLGRCRKERMQIRFSIFPPLVSFLLATNQLGSSLIPGLWACWKNDFSPVYQKKKKKKDFSPKWTDQESIHTCPVLTTYLWVSDHLYLEFMVVRDLSWWKLKSFSTFKGLLGWDWALLLIIILVGNCCTVFT